MAQTCIELIQDNQSFYAICPGGMDTDACMKWLLNDPNAYWYNELPAGWVVVACAPSDTTPSLTTKACTISITQARHDPTFNCSSTEGYILVSVTTNNGSGYLQYRVLTSTGTVQRDWSTESQDLTVMLKVPHGTYTVQVRDARISGCSQQVENIVVAYRNCTPATTQTPTTNPPITTGSPGTTSAPTTSSGGCTISLSAPTYRVGSDEVYEFPITYNGTQRLLYQLFRDGQAVGSSDSLLIAGGKLQVSLSGYVAGTYRIRVYNQSDTCSAERSFTHTLHGQTTGSPTPGTTTTSPGTTKGSCSNMSVAYANQDQTYPNTFRVKIYSPDGNLSPYVYQVWSADGVTMYNYQSTPVAVDQGGEFLMDVLSAPYGTTLELRVWSTATTCFASYRFAYTAPTAPTTAPPNPGNCTRPGNVSTYQFLFGWQPYNGTAMRFGSPQEACYQFRLHQNENPPTGDFIYTPVQFVPPLSTGTLVYLGRGSERNYDCQIVGPGYYYSLTEDNFDTGTIVTIGTDGRVTGLTRCDAPETTQAPGTTAAPTTTPITTTPPTTSANEIRPADVGSAAVNFVCSEKTVNGTQTSSLFTLRVATPGLSISGQELSAVDMSLAKNAGKLCYLGSPTISESLAIGTRGYVSAQSPGNYSFAFNVKKLREQFPTVGLIKFDAIVTPDTNYPVVDNGKYNIVRVNDSYHASSGINGTCPDSNKYCTAFYYNYTNNTKSVGGYWHYYATEGRNKTILRRQGDGSCKVQATGLAQSFEVDLNSTKKIGEMWLKLDTGRCMFIPQQLLDDPCVTNF